MVGVFSLVGLIVGAVFGADGGAELVGDSSGYIPLVALVAAVLGG